MDIGFLLYSKSTQHIDYVSGETISIELDPSDVKMLDGKNCSKSQKNAPHGHGKHAPELEYSTYWPTPQWY